MSDLDYDCPVECHGYLLYQTAEGNGRVLPAEDFGSYHDTMKLDIINDWIVELQEMYSDIQEGRWK